MRRTVILSVTMSLLIVMGLLSSSLFSHCQIPCGIYDDDARFASMLEHVKTLKKSVHEIQHLSAETPVNYNQLVRWINNKEDHADQISEIIFKYFLAQRIKSTQKNYETLLVDSHKIIVLSMNVKQTVDPTIVADLEKAILAFKKSYAQK